MAEFRAAAQRARGRTVSLVQLVSSNLLGAVVGGAFFLTASWNLPIEEMGRYAVAISAQFIAVGLIGSGLSVAALRLAADRLEAGDRPGAAGVVLQAAAVALALALAAAACGWLLHPVLPDRIGWLPALIAGWAGARSVIDCVRSGFLAGHDFRRAAMLMVGTASTGLAALAVLFAAGPITVERLLVAHVCGLVAGTAVAFALSTSLWSAGVRASSGRLRELLRYARWPALAEGTRLAQLNAGPFLLISLAGAAEAGVFGVARYAAYLFDAVALSLYQYWLSTAVRTRAEEGFGRYLGTQLELAARVGLLGVIFAIAAIPLLFALGSPFNEVAPLFVLSAFDFAVVMMLRSVESAYHGLHQPWLEWTQRLAVLPLLVLIGWVLIPPYGAMGMISANILADFAALGLAALLLRGRLARGRSIAPSFER